MTKKKILFLCPYPQNVAPSQRLKFEQYYHNIQENGYEVSVSSFVIPAFWKILYKKEQLLLKVAYTFVGYYIRMLDLFKIKKYDIIYVHLWVTPFGPPIFEWLFRRLAKKIVYDIDDMIFLGHNSDANSFIFALKGTKKINYLIKNADFVITGAPAIEKYASKYNENVLDIPPTLNHNRYVPKSNYQISSEIVLGYSGSHSTHKYLKSIEPVFVDLLKKGISFKVLIISNSDFKFDNSKIPVEFYKWELEKESELISKMDIGLFPLTDEPWVYGKRGGKAMLYMALGIPIIATATGVNLDTFKNNENSLLVNINDYEGWVQNIILLLNNHELREKIGKNARKTLEKRFSTFIYQNKYIEIFESLTNNKK